MPLQVFTIPYNKDNYAYYVYNSKAPTKSGGILIDCGDFNPIQSFLKERKLIPGILLSTHKHHDHTDGNQDFKAAYPEITIAGGKHDKIPFADKHIQDLQELEVGSLHVKAFHTPCHTRGHLLYHIKPIQDKKEDIEEEEKKEQKHENQMIETNKLMITRNLSSALFTGDTIFNGACGRFFQGNAEEMKRAFDIFRTFPQSQRFFHGHEYSVGTMQFGVMVEPDNKDMKEVLQQYRELRKKGIFTVPSTVGREKKVNIFMRTAESYLQILTETHNEVQVMHRLRQFKNEGKVPKL